MLFKKFNMNVPNNYSIGAGSVWMELAPYRWIWLHIDGAGSMTVQSGQAFQAPWSAMGNQDAHFFEKFTPF